MRIGIFCTGSNPVPPKNYGGTQAVNWETANALVEKNHDVILFAPKDSKSKANIVRIDSGWGSEVELNNVRKFLLSHVDDIDVIIDTSAFGYPGRALLGKPYIARMGGDPNKTYCRFFTRNLVFPSEHHLRFHSRRDCSCGIRRSDSTPEGARYATPIVPKPICFRFVTDNPKWFPLHEEDIEKRLEYDKEDHYLYLGLVAHHKGTHIAIEFASRLGAKLNIVGPTDKSDYFDSFIKPKLTNRIRYFQSASNIGKWSILAKAKAVVFPSICEEGDPNVPKEALLVGTPVIALDGTVSEIIRDGVTGIVCKDINEMLSRHREVIHMEPSLLRRDVLWNFGVDNYIDKTIAVLKRAIKGEVWI